MSYDQEQPWGIDIAVCDPVACCCKQGSCQTRIAGGATGLESFTLHHVNINNNGAVLPT